MSIVLLVIYVHCIDVNSKVLYVPKFFRNWVNIFFATKPPSKRLISIHFLNLMFWYEKKITNIFQLWLNVEDMTKIGAYLKHFDLQR